MGWIEALRGRIVAVDTAPFIYLIEENSTYLEKVPEHPSSLASIPHSQKLLPPQLL
ncbi:MAG: hypothetical protein ACUVV0_00610 [Anaerolineae bacterium]